MSFTPGACWSWPGSSCLSTPALSSSPCRSSWSAASRSHSRYVLSIVSLITFVISKIAVGIFAGGVVFATLMPEIHLTLGGLDHRTASGSARLLVIVLTGLYTILGGMRAVAYNDAVQVVVLIARFRPLTVYGLVKLGGWNELRAICGSDMFNLWKPLIPPGVIGTWAPVLAKNAAGQVVKQAWYFNGYYPWLGMLFCAPIIGLWYWCTDQYIVQRALGAPNEQDGPPRQHLRRLPEALPRLSLHHPGADLLRPGQERQGPRAGGDGRSGRQAIRHVAQAAFPMMVKYLLPPGLRGIVVAGLLSALMGSLAGVFNACSTLFTVDLYQKWKPERLAAPNRAHRPHRHRRHGVDRPGVDPGHPGRPRPLQLPAVRAGLPGPAHLRRLLLRRLLEAPERQGLPVGHDRRLRPRHLPHAGGHRR